MAFDVTKPRDTEIIANTPALLRENQRALRDDQIVDAGKLQGLTADAFSLITHTHASLHSHDNKTLLDSLISTGSSTSFLAADGLYHSVSASGVWGSITGDMSLQTDLQSALSGKASLTHDHNTVYSLLSHTHSDLHTHSNKTLLDGLISTGDGNSFLANDGTYKTVSSGSSSWGSITGTLSDQTDLQSALDGKSSTSHDHDSDYSAIGHDHNTVYSLLTHTHSDLHTHSNKTLLDGLISTGDGNSFLANDGTYKAVSSGGGTWGSITGTLSDQTDLQSALDGKSSTTHNHDTDYATLSHTHLISFVATDVDYTAVAANVAIVCDTTSNDITITLPAVADFAGKEIKIKKKDTSSNVVTIDANSNELIDGDETMTLTTEDESVCLISDGTSWYSF